MNPMRSQQILKIISKVLDPHSFAVNQFLISRLVLIQQFHSYAISISDLLQQPDFSSNHDSIENIIEAMKNSQYYYLFKQENQDYLIYPFQIFPYMLVLKQINKLGSREQIISYIRSLHGPKKQLILHDQTEDAVVTFPCFEDCMAFWRGMKYVPYNNHYIEGEIFSQARSFVLENPKQLNEIVEYTNTQESQPPERNSHRNQYHQHRNGNFYPNYQNNQNREGKRYQTSYRNRSYRDQHSHTTKRKLIPIKLDCD